MPMIAKLVTKYSKSFVDFLSEEKKDKINYDLNLFYD